MEFFIHIWILTIPALSVNTIQGLGTLSFQNCLVGMHILNNIMRMLWCWIVTIELKYLVNNWVLSDNGDLLEVPVDKELLILVTGTLDGISECLGHSTWCPGCKAIAVMGADCKEHICDYIQVEIAKYTISYSIL